MSKFSFAFDEYGEVEESKKARVHLTHLDAWSVAKSAFMLGVTIAAVLMVMSTVLWLLLSAAGVFESIVAFFTDASGSASFGISFLSLGRMVGLTMVISAVEITAITLLSALFAVLYNLSVGFTGGIKVTLSDRS